jgi:uncharacterized membrane protein
VKKPSRWTVALLIPAAVGLVDGAYLTINSYFSKVPLVCPSIGPINCDLVTSSKFSVLFGIHVALLGFLFFAVMLGLGIWRPSFAAYVMLPLWLIGIIGVGYLVTAEVFFLHAICLYCTLAHVCTAVMGYPIIKLTLTEL